MLCELGDSEIAVVTEFALARDEGEGGDRGRSGDAHAGEIETSRILHSHPHLVKGSADREFPAFPSGILVRDKRRYWPGGVWGDPGKATAAKGALLEELVVKKLLELVHALEKYRNER